MKMTKLKEFGQFLIHTKSEMKKVHWLSWKELFKNTVTVVTVVALGTVFFAVIDTLIVKALSFF